MIVDSLNGYIGPPCCVVFDIECEVVNIILTTKSNLF
jgi:hypothetical protein